MEDALIFTPTDLQYVLPEIWGHWINAQFEANLVAAPLFLDLSSDVAGGGDKIVIPDIYTNVFTASDKTNTSEVTLQSPATDSDTLSVDSWKEVSFLIEDKEAIQVLHSYNMQKRYAEKAAYTIAAAFDTAILTLSSSLTGDNTGTSTTDLADSDIRAAVAYMDGANVPQDNQYFIFHPAPFWSQIMGVTKYYNANEAGWTDSEAPMKKGRLGVLYGKPVYVTSQVVVTSGSYDNMLVQKQAFAYAKPMGLRTQANYIPESLGTLVTCDIIFGEVLNRAAAGYQLTSSS